MIISISLENWRSHENTYLEFRNGTNLLVGMMGSGKSSVLDGISFALFGTFPALEHRRLSIDELIKHEKVCAKIKLGFEWKKEKYEIIREIALNKNQKVSTDAQIRKLMVSDEPLTSKLIEKGQSAVTKYIEQLIQINYDLFSRAIYSAQNSIDYFLTMDPAKRKQELDRLLGLNKFEDARTNTIMLINRTKDERKTREAKFSRSRLEELIKKVADAKQECINLEKAEQETSIQSKAIKSIYAASESRFAVLNEKKERVHLLKEQNAKLSGGIEQLTEQLKQIQAKLIAQNIGVEQSTSAELHAKKQEIEKSFENAKKVFEQMQLKQKEITRQTGAEESKLENAKKARIMLDELKKELMHLLQGKKIEELREENEILKQESIKFASACESLASEIKQLNEKKERLSPELSECPLCKSQLTKQNISHVLSEYHAQISEKKLELKNFLIQKEQTSKHYSEAEVIVQKINMLAEKQKLLAEYAVKEDEYARKLVEMRSELANVLAQIKTKNEELEKFREASQQLILKCRALEDLHAMKNKLEQTEILLKKNEESLKTLGFSESEFEDARKDLEEKKLKMEKIQIELNSIIIQFKYCKEFFAFASEEKKALEEIENEIMHLLKLEEELVIYKNALLETQTALRQEVIEAMNNIMGAVWQAIYPYKDYKNLRMCINERGYDFEIYDEVWRGIGLISGGERATVALTFRIALASVLTPNISLLVLDEPTHNLDREAVDMLVHTLQYNLPEIVKQSFIITHDERLMSSEFARTYRLSRNKERNGATIFEEI